MCRVCIWDVLRKDAICVALANLRLYNTASGGNAGKKIVSTKNPPPGKIIGGKGWTSGNSRYFYTKLLREYLSSSKNCSVTSQINSK